ncbi:sulfite exporter TauE/SafE family protein [soil metagenome]
MARRGHLSRFRLPRAVRPATRLSNAPEQRFTTPGAPRLSIYGLPLQLIAELLLLGCFTGFLAGLFGVGGGMMLVPFMTAVLSRLGLGADISVKMAIATSMASILFTSLSSVRAHHKRGAVRWDLVRNLAPGIVIGGLLAGAGAFSLIKGAWLALFFALFVGFSATNILRGRKPPVGKALPSPVKQGMAGTGIGFVSGLVGAGGGFISVPYMTMHNVSMHAAVATSAALGFPIAMANVAGYVIGGWSLPPVLPGAFGYLFLPALAIVALASVTLAPLGARAAHAMNVAQLRRAFAGLLYALAAYMLYKGITAL